MFEGCDSETSPELSALTSEIRAVSSVIAAGEAERLRLIARLSAAVSAEATAMLAALPRVLGAPQDHEVIDSYVDSEVQVVLGIAEGPAGRLVELAQRLTSVLPQVLAALAEGRLDLSRARVLAQSTEVLPDDLARRVADELLAVAGAAPWDGLSPRAWRARADRAVIRADADAARRRRVAAHEARAVRSRPVPEGMAELSVTADAADIAMAMQVLTDLASARPSTGADGGYVSMDQRRVDAFVDVFRRLRDGDRLPGTPVRRERGLGLVLHADTFFGDGPAATDPAEVRGLGGHTVLEPVTAREQALAIAQGGTSGSVSVMLVDRAGVLLRLVRLPTAPDGGWTRRLLTEAVAARLDSLRPLSTETYAPTAEIERHVTARNPRCTGYNCPRQAHSCDLDHDTPWPRGPTDVVNLGPRCRRHHEHKTRGLVRTHVHPDGSVDTTMISGLIVTTRPEPLPGHAPGEGHAALGQDATLGTDGTFETDGLG